MEMRVEQLSVEAGVPVDTIRFYQSKGLLDPPRRQGRVAWYDDHHRTRLERIRSLQQRGFTLATIARLVSGDLDAADEALLGELTSTGGLHHAETAGGHSEGDPSAPVGSSRPPTDPHEPPMAPVRPPLPAGQPPDQVFTLAELAEETGVPLALLKAIEAEGLLIPRRVGTHERYTQEDVATAKAGLLLLDWGIPLSALLTLARRHHEATESVAHEAVDLFSTYVRGPLHRQQTEGVTEDGSPEVGDIGRLVQAYSELLPAVSTLVANHFTRTLVNAALDHVDQVGSAAERRAVWDQIGVDPTHPSPRPANPAPTAAVPRS